MLIKFPSSSGLNARFKITFFTTFQLFSLKKADTPFGLAILVNKTTYSLTLTKVINTHIKKAF